MTEFAELNINNLVTVKECEEKSHMWAQAGDKLSCLLCRKVFEKLSPEPGILSYSEEPIARRIISMEKVIHERMDKLEEKIKRLEVFYDLSKQCSTGLEDRISQLEARLDKCENFLADIFRSIQRTNAQITKAVSKVTKKR